jgi:hypothetical protein
MVTAVARTTGWRHRVHNNRAVEGNQKVAAMMTEATKAVTHEHRGAQS